MIVSGVNKGTIGRHVANVYEDGVQKLMIEFDYTYTVDYLREEVMFLHNENKERDESYNQQRYENYKGLKECRE